MSKFRDTLSQDWFNSAYDDPYYNDPCSLLSEEDTEEEKKDVCDPTPFPLDYQMYGGV